jgi:chemotaxis protein MotB
MRTYATGLVLLLSACVPQGKYDDAVNSADTLRARCALAGTEALAQANVDRQRLENLNANLHADEARLAAADAAEKDLLAKVDEKTVLAETLRRELSRMGENEALYKRLATRLKSVVDAGDLSIAVRSGRMVLRLPNDVLFDSGSADLWPAGKKTLGYIASVLGTVAGRRFQVAGHTDTAPIQSARFPSNWELSTARAVSVVQFLVVEGGVKPALLSAAGYGEFDPIAENTPADRAKNRRIEITLVPDVKDVVPVPDRY